MPWSERQTQLQRERRARTREERAALVSTMPCLVCGNPMFGARRRSRRYCSADCRQKAFRKRHQTWLHPRPRKPYQANPPQEPRPWSWGLTLDAKERLEAQMAEIRELTRADRG
jgi:hypothetical protein